MFVKISKLSKSCFGISAETQLSYQHNCPSTSVRGAGSDDWVEEKKTIHFRQNLFQKTPGTSKQKAASPNNFLFLSLYNATVKKNLHVAADLCCCVFMSRSCFFVESVSSCFTVTAGALGDAHTIQVPKTYCFVFVCGACATGPETQALWSLASCWVDCSRPCGAPVCPILRSQDIQCLFSFIWI